MNEMKVPRFPHFKTEEAMILSRFLEKGLLRGAWTFDFHFVTELGPVPPGLDATEISMWLNLHAKRADAVVETPDSVWILEVKRRIHPSAVGQLLLYADLYQKQTGITKPIRLGVVAGEDDKVTREFCERQKITVWIV